MNQGVAQCVLDRLEERKHSFSKRMYGLVEILSRTVFARMDKKTAVYKELLDQLIEQMFGMFQQELDAAWRDGCDYGETSTLHHIYNDDDIMDSVDIVSGSESISEPILLEGSSSSSSSSSQGSLEECIHRVRLYEQNGEEYCELNCEDGVELIEVGEGGEVMDNDDHVEENDEQYDQSIQCEVVVNDQLVNGDMSEDVFQVEIDEELTLDNQVDGGNEVGDDQIEELSEFELRYDVEATKRDDPIEELSEFELRDDVEATKRDDPIEELSEFELRDDVEATKRDDPIEELSEFELRDDVEATKRDDVGIPKILDTEQSTPQDCNPHEKIDDEFGYGDECYEVIRVDEVDLFEVVERPLKRRRVEEVEDGDREEMFNDDLVEMNNRKYEKSKSAPDDHLNEDAQQTRTDLDFVDSQMGVDNYPEHGDDAYAKEVQFDPNVPSSSKDVTYNLRPTSHVCRLCGVGFKHRFDLDWHVQAHADENPLKCPWPYCVKEFGQIDALKVHYRAHTGDQPFACAWKRCVMTFDTQIESIKHYNKYHSTMENHEFACPWKGCGKTFARNIERVKHCDRYHSSMQRYSIPWETRIKNKSGNLNPVSIRNIALQQQFSPSSQSPPHNNFARTLPRREQFKCLWGPCGLMFDNMRSLTKHRECHSPMKCAQSSLKCDWPGCEAHFTQEVYLTVHQNAHTEERPFVCKWPGCIHNFTDEHTLALHYNRTHA